MKTIFNGLGKSSYTVLVSMLILSACASGSDQSLISSSDTNGVNQGEASQYTSSIRPGSLEDFQQNVGDRVFFDLDQHVLDDVAQRTASVQANWLMKYAKNKVVTVAGHCDERGTREYNMALGARRANSLKEALIFNGVPSHLLRVVSYGKERPADPASNDAAWSQNRRAEIMLGY